MQKVICKNPEAYFHKVLSDVRGFAIFMMDHEGVVMSWNKGCELLKGYTAEEVIGQNYEILFPDFSQKRNCPREELDKAYKHGRYETEDWRRKKNGELYWAHVVLTKVLE